MVRFGRCSVDVASRHVERDGEAQHLEPQAFDLLAYLLSHRERVVSKGELLDRIWGDQFVSESALTTRIKEVRQALGDDGTRQAVVKNYRGRGYRFVAALDEDAATEAVEQRVTTRLIGREVDIAEVGALLEHSRLVTLVGPGGVGKTSLAQELSRRLGERFRDGVRTVRLAEVSDADSVIHALRRSTDLVEARSDEDAFIATLAGLDALVVVDNCEHVLEQLGRIVSDVLALDGDVRFLATSRGRLGLAGEQVWPVAPLDGDAARELLLDRARRAQPGFAWREGDEAGVDRILRAVDRLPLAIEMAAARLPTIGVEELAGVLTRRLDLLRSADRSAVERHRTIEALIGWSESLLSDEERSLLAAMSIFAGPVPVSDVAAVTGEDATELAIGPLADLVDKSLVVADASKDPTCYRLLETVRACAAPSRPAHVDRDHAHHIAEIVTSCDRRLRTPDEPAAAARLEALVAEVRTAHTWASANDPGLAVELTTALLWFSHERQWTEPALWARRLAPEPVGEDSTELAVAASLAAEAATRGDYVEAERLAVRAARSSDPRIAGSALETLGDIGLYTGALDDARVRGRALHELGSRLGDRSMQVSGLVGEVLALVYDGRSSDGKAVLDGYDPTVPMAPTSSAWLAYVEGELLSAFGRHDEAIDRFETAIRRGRSVGSRFVVSVAEVSSLAAASRTGDVLDALAAFRPVLVKYRQLRSDSHGITTIRNVIEALVRAERHEPAMKLLGAVSRPDVKSTYGVESDHLDDARAIAISEAGEDVVDRWIATGAAHDLSWAFDHAIDVLDEIERQR
ncbi:MAG TPA: winged helix-turn-helix domain-containing protein [Ilumatobacteraceae bacterium]|nr:winged helix-turn-helix domain-containing protein [Ilumatobacteraceae bacterium]